MTLMREFAVSKAPSLPTVDQHFAGRSPAVRETYDAIVSIARGLGPVTEDPKKTSIHLNRRSAFAGIQTRREFLILTIKSTGELNSGRIVKSEQTSASRWHHEIKLHNAGEVDPQIAAWLRDSYEISG